MLCIKALPDCDRWVLYRNEIFARFGKGFETILEVEAIFNKAEEIILFCPACPKRGRYWKATVLAQLENIPPF